MRTALPLLVALVGAACAKSPPATPTPRPHPIAVFDRASLFGPFPPEPVQPLPEPAPTFTYTGLEFDTASTRLILDDLSLAIQLEPDVWRSFPLLVDLTVLQTSVLCLPPTAPTRLDPWAGERCQTIAALRDWLGALDATAAAAPAIPAPADGPLADLGYFNPPAPPYMHLDADGGRFEWFAAAQFQPLSKRIVLTVASLELTDRDRGLRIDPTVPDTAVVCAEVSMSSGQHQERCTGFGRLRAWLADTGRPMPPPPPPPEGSPRAGPTLADFTAAMRAADAAIGRYGILQGHSSQLTGGLIVTAADMAALETQLVYSRWWRNENDGEISRVVTGGTFAAWLRAN